MKMFPELMLVYMNALSPCFSYYSRPFFEGYTLGLLLCSGRKCMKRVTSVCWFIDRKLSSWERFLAEHHWSLQSLSELWFKLLLSRLRLMGFSLSKLIFVLDTTLITKVKGKMIGVQKWTAHPGDDGAEKQIIGHHWAILGLVVPLVNRYLCFGLLSRLITGKRTSSHFIVTPQGQCRQATFWDPIHAMLWQTLDLTDCSITLLCDAYFSKIGFLSPIVFHNAFSSNQITVITRMRHDAVCFDLCPPSRKGNRGPIPKNPKPFKIRDLLHTEETQHWEVCVYGEKTQLQGVEVVRKIRDLEKLVKLVVIHTETSRPLILMSLDIHRSAIEIITSYSARFSIELLIRECKSEMGLSQYQCYTTIAIFRFVQLCLIITSLWKLYWIETRNQNQEISFQSLKKEIRLLAIRFAFSKVPCHSGEVQSFEPVIQRIIRMAA